MSIYVDDNRCRIIICLIILRGIRLYKFIREIMRRIDEYCVQPLPFPSGGSRRNGLSDSFPGRTRDCIRIAVPPPFATRASAISRLGQHFLFPCPSLTLGRKTPLPPVRGIPVCLLSLLWVIRQTDIFHFDLPCCYSYLHLQTRSSTQRAIRLKRHHEEHLPAIFLHVYHAPRNHTHVPKTTSGT